MTTLIAALAATLGAVAQRQLADNSSTSAPGGSPPIVSPSTPEEPDETQPPLPRPSLEQVLGAGRFELRNVLARFLPDATTDELETILEHWGPTVNRNRTSTLMWKMLLARWVEHDPPRAIAIEKVTKEWRLNGWCYHVWVLQAPLDALAAARKEENPEYMIERIIGDVADRELSAALPLIDEFPHHSDILQAIFKSWIRVSPEDALARLETLSGDVQEEVREAVLQEIAATSPEKALALVREEGGSKMQRLNAEASILTKLIKEDPIKATSHVLAMPSGKKRYELLRRLAGERVKTDPEGTLAWGKTLPEGSEKQAVIAAAASKLDLGVKGIVALLDEIGWHHASVNPLDTREVKTSNGGSGGHSDHGSLTVSLKSALQSATQEDLPAVLRLLAKHSRSSGSLIDTLTEAWAQDAPELMGAVLAVIPDRRRAATMLGNLMNEIRDTTTLLHYENALNNLAPEARRYAVNSFARKYADLDPHNAVPWARALEDGNERRAALERSMTELSKQDVQAAIKAYDMLEDPLLRVSTAEGIVSALGEEDAGLALEWLQRQEPDHVSPSSYRSVTRDWFNQDPLKASEWVAELPKGPARDEAVSALVQGLSTGSRADFEAAQVWASTMETNREQALHNLFGAWLERDRAAASKALLDSELPQQIKDSLISRQR